MSFIDVLALHPIDFLRIWFSMIRSGSAEVKHANKWQIHASLIDSRYWNIVKYMYRSTGCYRYIWSLSNVSPSQKLEKKTKSLTSIPTWTIKTLKKKPPSSSMVILNISLFLSVWFVCLSLFVFKLFYTRIMQ